MKKKCSFYLVLLMCIMLLSSCSAFGSINSTSTRTIDTHTSSLINTIPITLPSTTTHVPVHKESTPTEASGELPYTIYLVAGQGLLSHYDVAISTLLGEIQADGYYTVVEEIYFGYSLYGKLDSGEWILLREDTPDGENESQSDTTSTVYLTAGQAIFDHYDIAIGGNVGSIEVDGYYTIIETAHSMNCLFGKLESGLWVMLEEYPMAD